jgi:hypothetical protein
MWQFNSLYVSGETHPPTHPLTYVRRYLTQPTPPTIWLFRWRFLATYMGGPSSSFRRVGTRRTRRTRRINFRLWVGFLGSRGCLLRTQREAAAVSPKSHCRDVVMSVQCLKWLFIYLFIYGNLLLLLLKLLKLFLLGTWCFATLFLLPFYLSRGGKRKKKKPSLKETIIWTIYIFIFLIYSILWCNWSGNNHP